MHVTYIINSAKKKETFSHCQLRLFSANLTCVNICMNIRFNKSTFWQLRRVQWRWVCAHRRHCCQWCLVRTCLTTGLQALSPASLSLLQTVWALMEGIVRSWCNLGSCCCHPVPVLQVWCSDVPILCRCCYTWSASARKISCPSCLPVAPS